MVFITKIKPQKRRNRYNIYLDGKFAFGLDEGSLAKLRLKVGDEISEDNLKRLKDEGEISKYFDRVLRFLAFRPRSEKEIRDYLKMKLFKKDTREGKIEEIIIRLKDLNYIDEQEFASWWFSQRRRQFKGTRLIRLELSRKGINREIIEKVLAKAMVGSESDYELALKAAKKKRAAYRNLDKAKFHQKMSQFLARRGFDWETIRRVNQEIY